SRWLRPYGSLRQRGIPDRQEGKRRQRVRLQGQDRIHTWRAFDRLRARRVLRQRLRVPGEGGAGAPHGYGQAGRGKLPDDGWLVPARRGPPRRPMGRIRALRLRESRGPSRRRRDDGRATMGVSFWAQTQVRLTLETQF